MSLIALRLMVHVLIKERWFMRRDRLCLDPAALEGPLVVRRRRPGDRFEPWGLQAETKLKSYLISAGVPKRLRRRLWILSDARSVLWVLGLRPSERARWRRAPEEVIEVRIEPARSLELR